MYDLSDEGTGLPPLAEITPEDSMLALEYLVGAEGVVSMGEETMPVRYISVRGMIQEEEGPAFAQLHIAVPASLLDSMLGHLVESLEVDVEGDTPEAQNRSDG